MPPDAGRPRILGVHQAYKALCDAGVIRPDESISKIIIELDFRNAAVLMHIERYGDTRMLTVLPAVARGAEIASHDLPEGMTVEGPAT